MKTVLLIAADHIRALLHHRLLVGVMLISVAITAIFSVSLTKIGSVTVRATEAQRKARNADSNAPITAEERQKQETIIQGMQTGFQAFFYETASFGGSLVALFIFSSAVASEIRLGTIRVTLSKPVSRLQYLAGKFLGGIAVMAAYAIVASLALVIFAQANELTMSPTMKFAPLLMFSRQLMLGSLAMLLSLFVHPFVASILAFFAGNGFYGTSNPLYYVLPSYSSFNVFGQMLKGTLLSGRNVLFLELYAADFVVLMLVLAWWRFRTKELV